MSGRPTVAERIYANSEVAPSGCWQWTRPTREGYGSLYVAGRPMGAHRASYITFIGPIPEGLTVDHTCFNPGCVNPAHLRLLTRADNARNKDPRKPLWRNVAGGPKRPRPRSDTVLPADAPVIDFEQSA